MPNELAKSGGGLPANITAMASALATSAATAGASGSDKYMKMDRAGRFIFGAEDLEVEAGSKWAVNPMGFLHGWTCWGNAQHDNEGKNVGELMVPATQPLPLEEDLPASKGDWSKSVAVQLRCTEGEDKGIQVLFKTNSHGGRKAYAELLQAVVAAITEGTGAFVPLVELCSDSYKHAKYGKIFTPLFVVKGWVSMDGHDFGADVEATQESEQTPQQAAEPEKESEVEAPPRRRTRASAADEEPATEPAGDEPPPRRRRQRATA